MTSHDGETVVRLPSPAELEGRHLTLPDPDDRIEAPLAQANERSVDLAAAVLTEAFPTLPLERSSQATDATTFSAGQSNPWLLDALEPERMVETVLRRLHFELPTHIRFMRDKEARDLSDVAVRHSGQFQGGKNRLRPAALAAALDEGFTMVLDGVELRDRASIRLADQFERLFGCSVNINGYMSSRTYTSFGAHWDDQEVVILQLLGRKDWQVERPVALSPLKSSHGDETSGTVAWAGRVGPGDALYVPRGWGHLVSGIDELTFHYTITIPRTNGLTVLQSVLHDASGLDGRPQSPSTLPMVPRSTVDAPSVLISGLSDREVEQLIRRAVASLRFNIASRATQSLRAVTGAMSGARLDGLRVRSAGPGGWVAGGRTGDEVIVGMAGTLVAVPTGRVEELARFSDGAPHDASGIASDLLNGLLRCGLLEIVDDGVLLGVTG